MSFIDDRGEPVVERGYTQMAHLGNLDDVEVNGQRFCFETAVVYRHYHSKDDDWPSEIRAEWDNVQWIDVEADMALTVPACFVPSAPITDERQVASVSWGCLMERALIDIAEERGIWD